MTAKKDSINTSAVDTGSEREDLFKSVVEESPFLICSFEPDGTIEFVNRAYSEYFGKDQAELVGENFFTQIPEGDRERVSATLAGLTPKAPSQCHEHRVKETGDQIQWIRWTNRALFDKKGRVTHFQSFGEDVTGRRLVEEKLRYQATLLEHISDTVISTDADFKILSWNEAAERIFGWKAEEAIGKRFPELTNLEFTDDTREGILEQLHQRGLWEGEVNQQRKDGKRISILSAVSAIKDSEGKLIGTVGTCKDITEQKAEMGQREKDLHDLGERNKELRCIHTISESIRLRESLDDVFQDTVNAIPPGWHYPEITRGRLRYNDKEWISEPFEETVWSQSCDIVVHGEKCGAVEVYYIEECPELDEGPFMKDERDLLDGIGRALSETVERRIADENLQGSESHLKRAQELTQSGSWKLDLVSDDLIWSDEIFRIFELPPDTRFDYEAFKDRVYHEDREFEKENWQAALHGKPYDIEFRIHTGNGVKWVREKADFEFDNTGQAVRATGIVQDITARKEAEIALEESYSRLLRAEQIAQMGFIDWDLKTDEVTLSPQARNLYGIDSDSQVTLEQVLALVHPDDQEYVGENLNLAIEGVQDYKIDHRMIRPDGEIFWVQARADLELDENGESAVLLGTVVDITERQRAVEALRTSEIKYRAIVEDQTELICRFRFDGTRATLTFVNDAYCRYFDMEREDLIGHNWLSLLPKEDQELAIESLNTLNTKNPVITYEHASLRPTGENVWQEWTDRAIFDVDGKVVEYQSVGRDTTARRRAEIELQASEAKYRLLTENIMLGIVIVQDSPMRMLFANQGIASILGYSIQELTTLPPEGLENLIHPDDRLQFFRNFRNRLDGREVPSNYHVRGFRKDGTIVWLAVSAAIVNYDGQTGVQAIFVDITETKHTEIALKESEEKFRTLIEQVQDGIAVVQEGVVKFINPSIPSLLGYTTEEIINAEFASFIAPEELPRVSEMYRKRMNNEPVPTTYETVILRKDGTRVQMEINAGLTVYEGRDALQVLVRDITERKEAEEALRLSETNLVKAQEVAHIGSWHLDLIENILVWTEENYKIFGVPVGTPMTYETFLEVVHPEDRDYVDEKWRASIAGEPYDIVHRVLISDEVKWVREKAELTFDDQGNPISGIGITQDITERKQSEQQVQEYQLRLKALASELTQAEERERSRIAAELHDHVGQVLAFARIQVASARKRTSDLQLISTLDELSETLRQAIGDTRDLVFDLSSPLLKEIGIAAALSEWMETQIGKKHQLKTELIHDDQPIPMDTDVQALVFRTVRELLTNVVKHAQATHVTVCLEHKDDLLRISVKDDGVGYTDDWSSEQTERSRGFGLFNTQERMMDLGGSMEIITEAGKGCEVILLSPTHRNLRDE